MIGDFQFDAKGGAAAGCFLKRDCAIHRFDEAACGVQS